VTTGTIVFLHAHPDDEALISAGTIARAVDAGHRVVLVLATDGGAGFFDPSLLRSDESLGARRRQEAEASAKVLGVDQLVFLGFADSGLEPSDTASWPAGSLCAASVEEATSRLVEVLRTHSASMLIADDSLGGYGHADHVRIHEIATAATDELGLPFVEVTIDREFLSGGIELAASLGLEVPDGFVPPDLSAWYTPHEQLTHTVDVTSALDRKRASMAAHATQASSASADSVRTLAIFLGLPEEIFAIAFATEWFVAHDPIPEPYAELFTPVVQ
jgi:LmbE family N-acetylglucosaminyl deacetylase